jgi:hypothetical protein
VVTVRSSDSVTGPAAILRVAAFIALAWLPASMPVVSAQQATDQVPPPENTGPMRPERFAGTWAYSSEDSRNIATGRPERGAPGTAPPRPIVPRPAPVARDGAEQERASPFAPSPQMLRENRDLSRDLLEIAETLTFVITPDAVAITDDLGRERTYPTDNRRERYRLGASEFNARVRWDEDRLLREIEGSFGFRMTETYYLSPDASRLFLIIRVGEASRGRPQAGINRVYDRIESEGQ